MKLIVFITTSHEPTELTCHLNLTCRDICIYLPSAAKKTKTEGEGGERVVLVHAWALGSKFSNWPLFSHRVSYSLHGIQSARSSLNVRGRRTNVTQALMCTGIVIDGLNMVNKGKYAPVTLEHKAYTPTCLPSFIISLLSWPVQHRNINAVEVIALVCSNIIKPGKQYSGNLGKSGITNLAG